MFRRDAACILGILSYKHIGLPVANYIQQVGQAALGPCARKHIGLHEACSLSGRAPVLLLSALVNYFIALVSACAETAETFSFYAWSEARRRCKGNIMAYGPQSLGKGYNRVPMSGAWLAGKEHLHNIASLLTPY